MQWQTVAPHAFAVFWIGRAGIAVVALGLLAPSIIWIFRDVRVWPWDHSYYASLALRISYAMHEAPLAWPSSFLTIPDSRAPLLPWLATSTVPLIDVLGGAERALLLTNVAAGWVSLCLVYSATRRFGGSGALGFLAMLACAGTPDFVAFNQTFLVEAVQAMTVMGMAWMALRADSLSWPRLAAGTLFWTSLALLAKTTSLGYAAPFLLYIGNVCAISHRQRSAARLSDLLLLLAAVLLVAVTLTWYVMHWPAVVAHVKEATSGEIALFYGSDRPLTAKLLFWSRALLQALSPFEWLAGLLLLIAAVGLGKGLLRLRRGQFVSSLRSAVDSHLLFALYLAGTVIAGLLGYSKSIGEDVRFVAPMVPCVVLLFAWSLVALRSRWLHAGAVVLLALNWIAVHAGAEALVILPKDSLDYLQVPRYDTAAVERMSRAVREGCDRPDGISVIGADLSDFSAGSALLYAEKMRRTLGYRCAYASLGYLEGDVTRAIKKVYTSGAEFFITLPFNSLPAAGTNPIDRVSRSVAEWIATSPDFQRVTPDGDALVIYRRRR
jgi:hypothetical protein